MKVISQRLIRVLPTRGPEIGRDTAGCSISQPSPPLLRVSLTLLPLRRRHPPFGSPCGPLPAIPDRTLSPFRTAWGVPIMEARDVGHCGARGRGRG